MIVHRTSFAPWPVVAAALALALAGCPDAGLGAIGARCGANEACASGICGGNPDTVCLDPAGDADGDTLTNGVEATLGSDPANADTDGDGVNDGLEVGDLVLQAIDSDGDGRPDWAESLHADADADCIPDQLDARDDVVDDDFQFLTADYCPHAGVCGAEGATLAVRCDAEDIVACVFDGVPSYEATEVSCDELDNDCDGATDAGLAPCEAQITGLAADPQAVTVPLGRTADVSVLAAYDDDSSLDVTADATWSSDDEGVVTVLAGTLTPVALGATTVHASLGDFTVDVAVTVGPPAVDALALSETAITVSVGHTRALTLEAQYSDGTTGDVTDAASWSATDDGVATVPAGVVTGVAVGETAVTGAFEGVEARATVTVVADGCAPTDPCEHGGTCASDGVGGFVCECTAGYDGLTCANDVNDCAGAPCQHGGTCQDAVDAFSCACPNGWTGATCEAEVNGCADAPCQHGGACTDLGVGAYSCSCASGWTGDGCDLDVNECAATPAPCDAHADCANADGGYSCTCQVGWAGTGTFCANVNECLEGTDDCLALATCSDTLGGFTCACPAGYTGDGVTVCDDIDECALGTAGCHADADCVNTDGGASCTCKPGYSGNGTSCADVDECAQGTDDCLATADCTNTAGGWSCACRPGYSGDGVTACDDVDECTTGAAGCDANATCHNNVGGAVCTCKPGWAGDGVTCSNVNECLQGTDDCLALAICADTAGSYSCTCKSGYSGDGVTACDDVDECDAGTDTCDAHATCSNTVGSYSCACDEGWTGDGRTCLDVDECALGTHDCDLHATCTDNDGGWDCACDTGYSGDGVSCANIDDCAPNPCLNGGSCVDGVADFTCQCPLGFAGELCGTNVNGCEDAPCQHGGTCTDGVDPPFTCGCPDGWTGSLCELNVNECGATTPPCDAHATCADTPGAYTCTCKSGWTGDGVTCADIDECQLGTDDCSNDAICADIDGGFTCTCRDGYSGDGVICSNVDECQEGTDTCAAHASCADTPGAYTCTCKAGWAGDGETCSNVNECQDGTDTCAAQAVCADTQGGYTCTCKSGWSGDGQTCANVNECQQGTDNCSDAAICADTQGSYTCTCKAGYEGNGVVCDDIDECAAQTDTCDANATCTNTEGSYGCACKPGWSGDGQTCADVDECAAGSDDCDAFALCTNTPGSWSCACETGWAGSGKTCVDINECQTGADDCDAHATCANTAGGWTCTCATGWSGTGQACSDVDECAAGSDDCDAFALCTNTQGGWTCACVSGWTGSGQTCSDVDECATGADDCDVHATCTNTPGAWGCACKTGWSGTGQVCDDVDECSLGTDNCDDNATCSNTAGGWTCACAAGFTGDGVTCTDLNECAGQGGGDDCDANAICTNTAGGFSCACAAGYHGDGVTCVDDDECAGEGGGDDCDAFALCTNTPGSWTCKCAPGFFGDGTSCTACAPVAQCAGQVVCTNAGDSVCQDCADGYELSDGQCVDLDECALNTDGCPVTATCTNTPGGFTCTPCPSGYENGGADTCVDVDECGRGTDDCDPRATCANTAGGFTCTCPAGTWGPGTSCTDCAPVASCAGAVTCTSATDSRCEACDQGYTLLPDGTCEDSDECALGTDTCSDTQLCANIGGSYTCTDCDPGYWNDPGDGQELCVDVDECATGADDCDANASCTNKVGGFACTCDAGWYGDGKTCTACPEVAHCVPGTVTCSGPNDASCGTCQDGYAADGQGGCADVDECQPPDANNRCALGTEVCTNSPGGYGCTLCVTGTFNDPDDGAESCVDVDECALGTDDCDTRATCSNDEGGWSCTCDAGTWGSGQVCTPCTTVPGCRSGQVRCTSASDSICLACQAGYDLDPDTQQCIDSDECALNTDNCATDEICQNTAGSFSCVPCDAGYENGGDDICVDIDECQTGAHGCVAPGGVCRNTAGSYACDCWPGYGGPTCADAAACTLYVAKSAAPGGDGQSWGAAYDGFRALPPVVGPSCEVWVAEGVYTGSGTTAPVLQMRDGVAYYGGFAGGETALEQRDPDAHVVILDGQDVAYNVVVAASGGVLDGVTVTGGFARGASVCGGGLLARGVSGVALRRCVISANRGKYGGGVCVTGSADVTLAGVDLSGNQATSSGGGAYVLDSQAFTYAEGLIYDNQAGAVGAGLAFSNSPAGKLSDLTLTANATVFDGSTSGGALHVYDASEVTAERVAVRGNQADYGGGLSVALGSIFIGHNLVLADNSANLLGGNVVVNGGAVSLLHATVTAGHAKDGAAVYIFGDVTSTFAASASILWASAAPEYGGDAGGASVSDSITTIEGPGNQAVAPQWVLWPTDLRLFSSSPAIDQVKLTVVTDDIRQAQRASVLWGNPDFPGDLGAYEFQPGPTPRDPYVWHVNQDAQGQATGYTWPDAFFDLDKGLDSAQPGDMVWVAGRSDVGVTYRPATYGSGGDSSFVMPPGIALFGGFDAADTRADLTSRKPATYLTILSCDGGEKGQGDNLCGHVLILGKDVWVDGFTIRGGNVKAGGAVPDGGGVLGVNVGTTTLKNLLVRDNFVEDGAGGGVSVRGCEALTVSDVYLDDNHVITGNGGGAQLRQCAGLALSGLSATNNSAKGDGGGLYLVSDPAASLQSVAVTANSADGTGGGVLLGDVDGLAWTGGEVSRNLAGVHGGGIRVSASQQVAIAGVAFDGNTAKDQGGGVRVDASALALTGLAIRNNQAARGGGLFVTATGDVILDRVVLDKNAANVVEGQGTSAWGGGFLNSGLLYAVNTLVSGNTAASGGPAGLTAGGDTTLFFTTVAGHLSQKGSLSVDGVLTVKNSVVWPVESSGPEIDLIDGQVVAASSDIGGSAQVCGGAWSCEAVFDAYPYFVGGTDYHPTAASPMVDKAEPDPNTDVDLDQQPRPQQGGWDMGCYELSEGQIATQTVP